jgi:hypothetical protein
VERPAGRFRIWTLGLVILLGCFASNVGTLALTTNEWKIADALWVHVDTLPTRMNHLHPSERHYLRRRMHHTEGIA